MYIYIYIIYIYRIRNIINVIYINIVHILHDILHVYNEIYYIFKKSEELHGEDTGKLPNSGPPRLTKRHLFSAQRRRCASRTSDSQNGCLASVFPSHMLHVWLVGGRPTL